MVTELLQIRGVHGRVDSAQLWGSDRSLARLEEHEDKPRSTPQAARRQVQGFMSPRRAGASGWPVSPAISAVRPLASARGRVGGSYVMKPQSFRLIPDMEERYCMSVGVLAGDFLFIGGLFDVDDEGNALHPEDAAMQFRGIYEQMNHVLAAHGGTAADVVSETIYYGCSAEEYSERLVPHRLAFYQGCNGPSVVGVQVAGFIEPAIQVEVTAVAYLPARA